jgi:hypothetical protein
VGLNLVQNIRWKWSIFKAMPGLIPAPNSGSFVEKNKKNIGCQMGQTDKKNILKNIVVLFLNQWEVKEEGMFWCC